jgi:23S rRNA (uridine2552-2'-O)-methyltransferase
MQRHVNDPYVKMAEKEGNRSRAAYKLQELQDKYKIIRPKDYVIDLGAAPGGWSFMASKILDFTNGGLLVSIDLLQMEHIPTDLPDNQGAHMILGNFNSPVVRAEMTRLAGFNADGTKRTANVVLSDMLQNTTGHASTDHLKSMNICYSVLDFTQEYLQPGGHLLCKFFQGSDDKELLEEAKLQFQSTRLVKPKSSRTESREMYLLGLHKIG